MKITMLRYQWEGVLGVGLALFAFGAYYGTLCPSVVPGNSALAFVSVLQADAGHQLAGHPLWHIAARLFSLLPYGDLPWRLNMFSALCGAGAVFFLFRLVTLILYDVMSEDSWIEQIDEDLKTDELQKGDAGASGTVSEIINNTGHRIAMVGGALSAVAFAFCAPFWLISTSLHYQSFELLLLLAAAYALTRYYATSCVSCLVMAALLLGLGVVEDITLLIFLPIALVYFFSGGYRHGHISVSFIALIILLFAGAALLAFTAQVVWVSKGDISIPVIIRVAALWLQSQTDGLSAILARKGWLLILVQGVLPLLIVFKVRHRFAYEYFLSTQADTAGEDDQRNPDASRGHVSNLFWGLLLLILLAVVAHGLLNLPGSPWYFARGSAYLPVMPLLGIAMAFGFLFSYALLYRHRHLAVQAKSANGELPSPTSRWVHVISGAIAAATCLFIAVTVSHNKGELHGQKAGFVDLFCREILKAAPEARCFVTEGMLDMNLRVQARLMNREITLLNAQDLRHSPAAKTGAAGSKGPTTGDYLRGWLSAHPESRSQVAVLTAPRVWHDAGFQAIPSTLVYHGAKPHAAIDLKALLQSHLLFWKTNRQLFEADLAGSRLLSYLQSEMRMHVSRIANDLGVLCLHRDAQEEARGAFALAVEIDPKNLCAWMNHCAPDKLLAQTTTGNPTEKALERITALIKGAPAFDALSDWEKHYGALYLPAVEHIANRYNAAKGTADSTQGAGVKQQSRDYVRAALQAKAEARVPRPRPNEEGIDEEMIRVVEALAGGYAKAAESQARNVLRKRRTSLVAWSLLAEALMNQKNFAEVQDVVLPEMRFIVGAKGSEWIEMTEGALAMRQAKPDFQVAHDHFLRVFHDHPEIEEAQNLMIQTALSMGNMALLEKDCKAVLEHSPHQPMANAALGALRLNQARLEEAEKALAVSIAARPSSLAFNDLGETLRQMKKLEAAEAATRRALILDEGCYQAWDTLALILSDMGKVDEAAEAHRAALRLCQTDIRLYLAAAQFEQVRGDFKAARKLLQESAPLLAHAATQYKDKYNDLLKRLPN
jgi:tetratricopeptide (TPR) repeat protein